jgi:hypothetical protein
MLAVDSNGNVIETNSLGTHTATQNLTLGSNWLSGDGDDEGIQIGSGGDVFIPKDLTVGSNLGSGTAAMTVSRGSAAPSIEGAVNWLILDGRRSANGNAGVNYYSSGDVILANGGGDVGVGETAPDARLHVKESLAENGSFPMIIENTANAGWANGLLIKAGQNTQSVNNRFISFSSPDGTELGAVRQINSSQVDFNQNSDRRLKTDIRPTSYGLKDLMQIEVADYVFKGDANQQPDTGFIAQQLAEHYPVAVSKGGDDPKTDPWGVSYGRVTPLLVKAVQEQQAQIDQLQTENEQLRARLNEINTLKKDLLAVQELLRNRQDNKKVATIHSF